MRRTRRPVESPRVTPTPRYHQVYVAIQEWIRDGVYAPGAQLPTEAALCDSFGVSRITVRRGLEQLTAEGWLRRQQGRGTFVTSGARPAPVPIQWIDVLSSVAEFGRATTARDLVVSNVEPDERTRLVLSIAAGATVRRTVHTRLLRGTPLGLVTTWLPEPIAALLSKPKLTQAPTVTLLEKAGIVIGDSDQTVGSTLAGLDAMRHLGVPAGTPLVQLERIIRDSRGRGVERMLALYRADMYQYRMTLKRRRTRSGRRWTTE